MRLSYTCNYCNNKWEETPKYSWDHSTQVKCPKCKDTNIRKIQYTGIDTYPETKAKGGKQSSNSSTPKTC